MSSGTGRLYNAYPSDSESDTDSASSDYTQRSDITTNYLINIPGTKPPVRTGYQAPGLKPDPPPNTGTTLDFKQSNPDFRSIDNTSLFMLNSRDRDLTAYPLPTFFTLRLPRVYKNVKSITLNQINLLNSFFNFTAAQQNTTIYVYEEGRTLSNGTSNIVAVKIPDGTYNSTDLVTALNNAMNATPLFANISFVDFSSVFQQSGNFTILFNTPGPVVYNALTNTYQSNLSINDVVNWFFQTSQTAGTTEFTYNQTLVAYYYPIIYLMIATANTTVPFSTGTLTIPTGFTSWYNYILFGFQGLNDPYITAIALEPGNQTIFDDYHYKNTFNTSLINQYNCSYNSQQGRLVISAPSLTQSIATDLTVQYSNILNALISSNDATNPAFQIGTIDNFNTLYANLQNSNAVVTAFYNYLQGKFTSNFGINFGTYSAQFYANSNNQITIYNTLNQFGWNLALTPTASFAAINSNPLPTQTSNYWPNIIFSKTANTTAVSTFVSTILPSTFPIVSNVPQILFSNAGESELGYTDIVFPILPTSYVRTIFGTRYRQNISLMTIPRYLNNRGPGTQQVYNFDVNTSTPSLLFDVRTAPNEYILTDISGVTIFNMYTIIQNMFNSADYMRAYNQWQNYMYVNILSGSRVQPGDPNYNTRPPITSINMTSFRPFMFFQVDADQYPISPNALFYITFYVETQDGTPFPTPITITWYKDRAGFMADALPAMNTVNINTENPRHYFQTQTYGTNLNSATMSVPVTNLQQTYFYVHYTLSGNQPSVSLRVFCLLTNAYGVYTQATPNDLLDMPYANLSSIVDQNTPQSAEYQNNLISIYSTSVTSIGYDISDVSNNLADYIIVGPNNNYYDPTNIQTYQNGVESGVRYQFNLSNAGAPVPAPNLVPPWSLYFGSNSSNTILDLYNTSSITYLSSLETVTYPGSTSYILNNESVLASFLDPTLPTNKEIYLTPGQDINMPVNSTSIFQPCINYTSPTVTDSSTSLAFADTTGISGLGFFLPPNNIVNLSQFIVKFAYTSPTETNTSNYITRASSPFVYYGPNVSQGADNGWLYNNSATSAALSTNTVWDDWYLWNRINTKLAIFPTAQIRGTSTSMLSLSSALYTMTLNKVTQVCQNENIVGTLHTREPDWGTFYEYTIQSNSTIIYAPFSKNISSVFSTIVAPVDIVPTYTAGDTSYPGYILTEAQINNYSYLPRSYGIAPSVGNAVNYPYPGISSYTSDIPNSYTAVPFSYNVSTQTWSVGSFYAVSFTRQPALPSTGLIGAAPFYGPPGIFGWNVSSSVFALYNGEQPTFQPYYWLGKVSFTSLVNIEYNPATDLAAFGGFAGLSGEYQDTMMFFYGNNTLNADYADISTTTKNWTWGNERNTNYLAYDDQGGYNFLSYLYNLTVRPTVPQYAVHVRGYDPIPQFTTGLRIIGNNYTNFGTPTLGEIAQEISSLKGYSPISDLSGSLYLQNTPAYNQIISTNNGIRLGNNNQFSHAYADALINFNSNFLISSITFGTRAGFQGAAFTFTGYQNTLEQYTAYFSTVTSQFTICTNILSTTTGLLNEYVIFRYGNILPPGIVSRSNYTAPIPFQLLFDYNLQPPYNKQIDQWGLGWYLGFPKLTVPVIGPRTLVTSATFIRIVQNYIYLRLNPAQNINTLAVSAKENLSETRESQGMDTQYFTKIILADFANYCRAGVQLQKEFSPVLGKYEVIECQLTDQNGNILSNTDCDYDMVVQITETTNGPTVESTLLGPKSDLTVYQNK